MHHPRTVLALVLTGTLLLGAGCSDEGAEADPQPILPSSSSASPTDEPTPSASPTEAPTMPAAAKERSYDGAIAFVEHWVDSYNRAQNTGDTEALESLSDGRCVSCTDAVAAIEGIYGDSGILRDGEWRLKEVGYDPIAPLRAPILSSSVAQAAEVVEYGDERPDRATDKKNFEVFFLLRRDSGGWLMRELEVQGL